MVLDGSNPDQATAVLFSGGLDSAVLLAEAARHAPAQPIYVSAGLAWETQEPVLRDAIFGLLRDPVPATLAR